MQHLTVEQEGGIWTCRISNPPGHTLTAAGVVELLELVGEAERSRTLRVLVLTGAGEGVFVAHYDVGELVLAAERGGREGAAAERPAEAGALRLHPFHRLLLRLEGLSAVTVAAINGHAGGGGCELALACDFRLMAAGPFHFGLFETDLGIIPGAGGTQRMARLLGTARALDLILHGRLLGPVEALELGLVHRLFAPERFAEETRSFAARLAARAPLALAAAKEAIRKGVDGTLAEGLAVEQSCFERTLRTKDAFGAMRAWLRGEGWEWTGE